jgi:hypothetical protein
MKRIECVSEGVRGDPRKTYLASIFQENFKKAIKQSACKKAHKSRSLWSLVDR